MDPISIIAAISVCGEVAKLTWQFSEGLFQIAKDPKAGNAATLSLATTIKNLSSSCTLVEEQLRPIVATYEQIASQTERDRLCNVWTGVERCARDAHRTILELEKCVEGVSKEAHNPVSQIWKNARLKLKKEDIDRFRGDISDHNTGLQISLQVLGISLLYLGPQRVDAGMSEKLEDLTELVTKADASQARSQKDILREAREALNDAETLYEGSVADDMSVVDRPHARKVRAWASGIEAQSQYGVDPTESLTLVEEDEEAAPYDEIDATHLAQVVDLIRQGDTYYEQRLLDRAYKSYAQAKAVEELLPTNKRTAFNNVTDRYRYAVTAWSNMEPAKSAPILRKFYLSPAAQTHPAETAHVGHLLASALFKTGDLESARAVGLEVMHATRKLDGDGYMQYYQSMSLLAEILDAKGETSLAEAYISQIPAARARAVAGPPHAGKYWLQAWLDAYNVKIDDQVQMAIVQGQYSLVARLADATKGKSRGASKYVDWMKPGSSKPKEGLSSAHLAALSGDVRTFQIVTEADSSALAWPPFDMTLLTQTNDHIVWKGVKPVHLAAYLGHGEIVRTLLAKEKYRTAGQDYTRTLSGESAISFLLRKDDIRPRGFQTVERCVDTLEALWDAEARDKDKSLRAVDGAGQHVLDLVYGNPLLIHPEVFRFIISRGAMRPHGKDDQTYYRRLISANPTPVVVDCVRVVLQSGDFAEFNGHAVLGLAVKAYASVKDPASPLTNGHDDIKAYASADEKVKSPASADGAVSLASSLVIDLLIEYRLRVPWPNQYRPVEPIVIGLTPNLSTDKAQELHDLARKHDRVAVSQGPQGEWGELRRVIIVGCYCANCSTSPTANLARHYTSDGEFSLVEGCECCRCETFRLGPRKALTNRKMSRRPTQPMAGLSRSMTSSEKSAPPSPYLDQTVPLPPMPPPPPPPAYFNQEKQQQEPPQQQMYRTNTGGSSLTRVQSPASVSNMSVATTTSSSSNKEAAGVGSRGTTSPTIAAPLTAGLSRHAQRAERRLEKHLQRVADQTGSPQIDQALHALRSRRHGHK